MYYTGMSKHRKLSRSPVVDCVLHFQVLHFQSPRRVFNLAFLPQPWPVQTFNASTVLFTTGARVCNSVVLDTLSAKLSRMMLRTTPNTRWDILAVFFESSRVKHVGDGQWHSSL